MVAIPLRPDVVQPIIYNLATDYTRFNLTKSQADRILTHRFTNRFDPDSGLTGSEEFIVHHVQAGSTIGSLGHWLNVQASSNVMANKDGSLLRVIPDEHGPWTNGDVINPLPPANEILGLGGNPNIWSLTLEGEGQPWDALTPEQLSAIVWQFETWMIKNPKILAHVWSVLRHRHINSRDKWRCPDESEDGTTGLRFSPVMAHINKWLATADDPPEQYAEPKAWPRVDGLDHLPFVSIVRKVTVLRGGGAECYAWASRSAPRSSENIPMGTIVPVAYAAKNDEATWYVHADGHRMPMTHFVERFSTNIWG